MEIKMLNAKGIKNAHETVMSDRANSVVHWGPAPAWG